jgi:hypothetical protein
MIKARLTAVLVAGLFATALSASANASVLYDLTFDNNGSTSEGTGVLTLNFTTLSQTYNLGYQSITPYFTSVTTTAIDGYGPFSITPSNLKDGDISSGPIGQLYTLTVEQDVPTCDSNGTCDILILDLYTGGWQIHDQYDSTLVSGNLSFTGPTLAAATPLPATLPLFAGGLGFVGYLSRRRKGSTARQVIAVA